MNLTQYEARGAKTATLRKEQDGVPKGTVLSLVWRRSYLDRPRYLGGRLRHEFDASPPSGSPRLRLTDRQLTDFVLSEHKSSVPAP